MGHVVKELTLGNQLGVPNRSCLTTESKFVSGLKRKNYHPATVAHIKNAGALDLYFIGL